MNQLVREDNYLLNKTYIFTYDTSGNILSKKTYNSVLTTATGTPDSTINYTYASNGWKDQLVSFGNESIVYDALGNPTAYRGHNLTWGKLRQLNSFDNNTFTYNAEGIRTSKNNITYTLDGTKILAETRATGIIKYLYGINGVIGFTYNGNTYYYEKNVQGDVTAIVDDTGAIKAKYVYDAWGNHTITLDTDGIGALNSIRYRSYYFDTETGLYYLNSRYYDPVTCRFINADELVSTGQGLLGYNMFAYGGNNPVNRIDPTGEAWWHWALGAAVVAACAVATVVTCGGFAAAAGAVVAVGSGVAAATTASTIAAGAFIGSATVYGMAVVTAASTSSSVKEFNDKGNWETVAATVGGAVVGGAGAYLGTNGSNATTSTTKPKVTSTIKNDIIDLPRTGHALKTDPHHAFPNIVDNYAGYATKTPINNATLYQLQGSLNGTVGRFEWIVQNQQVTHRMFVEGGRINGIPILK